MITLYTFGNSVCCQKVRIVLAEKQLDWTPHEINLFANEQYDPEYLKLNPAGTVPTLVHEGDVIAESTLICEYLDELYSDPPLMPNDPAGKAQARIWSKIVDEGLHEGVSAISFAAMFRERMRAMTPAQRDARYGNVGDPRRGDLFRQTYEHGAKAKQVIQAVAAYERMFERLESTLRDDRPWIMGERTTLADISLMPYMARLDYLRLLELWIDERRHVQRWWDYVRSWPSFRAGVTDPMISSDAEEMATHGPTIRAELSNTLQKLRVT